MKRSNSFVCDFKRIKYDVTSNVDDKIIKSMTPPKTNFLDDNMKSITPPNPSFLLNYFANRKNSADDESNIKVIPTKD